NAGFNHALGDPKVSPQMMNSVCGDTSVSIVFKPDLVDFAFAFPAVMQNQTHIIPDDFAKMTDAQVANLQAQFYARMMGEKHINIQPCHIQKRMIGGKPALIAHGLGTQGASPQQFGLRIVFMSSSDGILMLVISAPQTTETQPAPMLDAVVDSMRVQ